LRELGITALYLNPVFASASNHRYHTFDYELVDPLLGGDAALRELLDEAHKRGMRVILDGVFNHASRGFWPFHHVLENGAASPYRDWFHLDPEVLAGGAG
jgi:cyclomaltodextrinase